MLFFDAMQYSERNGVIRSHIITKPDDWHVHLRDTPVLHDTVAATAMHFNRALVMPNLVPAISSIDALLSYRERILLAATAYPEFNPYMTLYLNEDVTPDTIQRACQYPFLLGAKLYPRHVTTNSQQSAATIDALYPTLEAMQACDLVLQVHGETANDDIFEREALFIQGPLTRITADFPKLRMVLEHISTLDAVEWVLSAPSTIAATITPQHLLYNRNHLLSGGIKPHYYCLPILKHSRHQHALIRAALSQNPKFFAGTDSAPHAKHHKENACGCAGIFSAPYALALYAQLFDQAGHMDRLEAFVAHFGADFYQLPRSTSRIELVQQSQQIPATCPLGDAFVVPLASGEWINWSINASH